MPRGGARPGAGRKSKNERNQKKILQAEARIGRKLPDLIDLQFSLAHGEIMELNPFKTIPTLADVLSPEDCQTLTDAGIDPATITTNLPCGVYVRPPSRPAIQYLIDRVMGKPAQLIETELTVEQVQEYIELYAACWREVLAKRYGMETAELICAEVGELFAGRYSPGAS